MDLRNTFAGGLARLSGRGFGAVRRPGPSPRPWPGLVWFADVDCFEAYPLHKNQLARTEPGRVLPQRPKTPPKGDYTVHGGQVSRVFVTCAFCLLLLEEWDLFSRGGWLSGEEGRRGRGGDCACSKGKHVTGQHATHLLFFRDHLSGQSSATKT